MEPVVANKVNGKPLESRMGSASGVGTHPNLILAICCLSLFLVTMDVTIVNVAMPAIQRDLSASIQGLQWSIDGYTVVVASFLMLGGSTADRLGRKRVFQTGLLLFSLGSLLCSLAGSTTTLVLARMLQALGGSMLNPVAMSIVTNTFTEAKARARAIGLWGAVVGISMAAGPILGGLLTQTVGWRSIFWINVPIGLLAFYLTARFIPESRAAKVRRFDPVGQALVVVALVSLISASIEGRHLGWDSSLILGLFATFGGAVTGLIFYEKGRSQPLIDVRFFQSIRFSSATLVAIMAFTSFSGFLFLNSLYLQNVRHYEPTQAGMCLLPTALMMILCSPLSGRLVGAGRARLAMVTSGLCIATSALLLTTVEQGSDLPLLLLIYGLFGIGFGMVNAPITNAAVSGMPNSQAGLAAALASTSRQVGASLGVALAGSIVGSVLSAEFTAAAQPFWWIIVGCGLTIVSLGVLSTGDLAKAGDRKVAHLLSQ